MSLLLLRLRCKYSIWRVCYVLETLLSWEYTRVYNWYQRCVSNVTLIKFLCHQLIICVKCMCITGTCIEYTSIFTPAYRVIVFFSFLFCLSVFMLGWDTGTSSSSPDFCQLRFQGLAHMESWFQSLLHLTWFQSPFSCRPCRFWGRPSLQDSSTWTRPGTGEQGNEGERRKEGEWGSKAGMRAWKWVFTHFCAPSLLLSRFVSYLL